MDISYILRCGLVIVDYHAVLTGDVLLGSAQLSVDLLMSIVSIICFAVNMSITF